MKKNSNSSRPKVYSGLKLDDSIKGYIVPMVVFGATIILLGVTLVNTIGRSEYAVSVFDPWVEAFTASQNKMVGVAFSQTPTTSQEYTALRMKANEFIESDLADTIKLDSKIKVTEDQFVDADGSTGDNKETKQEQAMETGPLYLDDMLIIRYITDAETLNVVTSKFNGGNKSKVESVSIIKSSEIRDYSIELVPTENISSNMVSESNYLIDIKSMLVGIFNGSINGNSAEASKLKKIANGYLSADGKRTLLEGRSKTTSNIEADNTVANVVFIEACRSSETQTTKDRIYAQVEVRGSDGKNDLINIILKMNSVGRIFDVDIL